jgi:CheY-like chemotaxis protein
MGVLSSSPDTESMHSAAVAAPSQKPLRILVADDEPTNRLVLSTMLSRYGYTVFTAGDGQEALDVFDREQPDSDIFYEMTANGYALVDIVAAINHKLKVTMPRGVFCAACLLAFNMDYSTLTVWNGGIPDLLLYRKPGESSQRIVSKHLPLGVVGNDRLDRRVDFVDLKPGNRLYAYTDGVIEARDLEGESFGQQRLEAFFVQNQNPDALFDEIHNGLTAFRAGRSQSDDITLIEVTCDTTLANSGYRYTTVQQQAVLPIHWQMALELGADALRRVDPMITEIQGLHEHRERLFTVLAELFSNALEHGVLGLRSTLKDSPQGFAERCMSGEEPRGRVDVAADRSEALDGS